MATNESQLVEEIVAEVRRRWPHAWVFKVVGSPYQMSGVPDLLICVNGVLVGAEVKFPRPGESRLATLGRASKLQQVQIKRINRSGGLASVVTSTSETVDLIERALIHCGPGNEAKKEKKIS